MAVCYGRGQLGPRCARERSKGPARLRRDPPDPADSFAPPPPSHPSPPTPHLGSATSCCSIQPCGSGDLVARRSVPPVAAWARRYSAARTSRLPLPPRRCCRLFVAAAAHLLPRAFGTAGDGLAVR